MIHLSVINLELQKQQFSCFNTYVLVDFLQINLGLLSICGSKNLFDFVAQNHMQKKVQHWFKNGSRNVVLYMYKISHKALGLES